MYMYICDRIWGNQPVNKKNQLSRMRVNHRSSMKMLTEIKKKKRVLLEDKASNWLQIWMMASSPDVKGNNAIKIILFFSLTGWFSQIWSHIVTRTRKRAG